MKKLILAAAAGLLCYTQAAMAEIRTFEFSATVGNVLADSMPVEHYFGWDGSNREVAAGDAIVGYFSFDDAAAPWGQTGEFVKVFDASLSFKFANGLAFGTTKASALAAAEDDDGARAFTIAAVPGSGKLGSVALFLGTHADPSTPYPSGLEAFEDRGFILNWSHDNRSLASYAMVNSITEVSAVPEPSTWCMLIGGLALVGAAARRRPAA